MPSSWWMAWPCPGRRGRKWNRYQGGRPRSGLGQGLWDTPPSCQDGGVSPTNDIFKSPPAPEAVHAALFGQRVCWVGRSYFNGWHLYTRRAGALGTDPGAQGEPHVVTGAQGGVTPSVAGGSQDLGEKEPTSQRLGSRLPAPDGEEFLLFSTPVRGPSYGTRTLTRWLWGVLERNRGWRYRPGSHPPRGSRGLGRQ